LDARFAARLCPSPVISIDLDARATAAPSRVACVRYQWQGGVVPVKKRIARLSAAVPETMALVFVWGLVCGPPWGLAGGQAWADDAPSGYPSSLRFSGFATYALTHNDSDEAGAIASFGQKRPAGEGWSPNLDSVIGGQIDWSIAPQTSLTIQGVARPGDDMEPELRMGFLRQQLGNNLALRLGRIRSPMYFDSDVSEIGYAYLMAHQPLPLYVLLNTFSWIDGGDLQWRHSLGNTVLLMQGYGGEVNYQVRVPGTSEFADNALQGLVGLAVSAITPNVTYRASHTYARRLRMNSAELDRLNDGLGQLSGGVRQLAMNPLLPTASRLALNQQAGQIDALMDPYDGENLTYTSLGFDAYLGQWRLMGEWVRVNPDSEILGVHQGYQLTAGYSIGKWTPYLSFARFRRQSRHLDTSALSVTGLEPGLDAGLVQAKAELDSLGKFVDDSSQTISLGVRWDFRENMDLKLQYDHFTTPNQWTPGSLSVRSLPFDNRVNLVTVAIDVIF
jgi:hypothetical protein